MASVHSDPCAAPRSSVVRAWRSVFRFVAGLVASVRATIADTQRLRAELRRRHPDLDI